MNTKIKLLARKIGARLRELGYGDQPREAKEGDRYKGRFVHPIRGVTDSVANTSQSQVIKSVFRTGQKINKYGGRGVGLVRDVADVAAGRERQRDARGVPKKRTWEKAWFKNAVTAAAIGAGTLGLAHTMRKNPKFKAKVEKAGDYVHAKTHGIVKPPSWLRTPEQQFAARLRKKLRMLNWSAPDWDVRDQRGRSARVFAPGSRPRERREKKWYEKAGTQRKIAAALAGAALVAGGAGGYVLGKKTAAGGKAVSVSGSTSPSAAASIRHRQRGASGDVALLFSAK